MPSKTTKTTAPSDSADTSVSPEDQRNLYYHLVKVRRFDERCRRLFKQGRFPGTYFSQVGQEATTVGPAYCLKTGDLIAPSHRDMGAIITKGVPLSVLLCQVYARANSPDKGKSHPCHFGYPELNVLTPASTVAGQVVVGTGAAMAFKIQKAPRVVLCGFGEGATSRGGFHEALNYAGIHDLPVVYVCQNNGWAESVPASLQSRIEHYADRAKAYGFEGITIDGNDVLGVYSAARKAINKARQGEGPTLIECLTYRWYGHSEIDPANYRTKEELESWKRRDPVAAYESHLDRSGVMKLQEREEVIIRVDAEIEEAIRMAEESPHPEPEEALDDVYSFSPAVNYPRGI
jgi:TPP-dependent pyruvate/acetoin dehydrogenase alpha subunit